MVKADTAADFFSLVLGRMQAFILAAQYRAKITRNRENLFLTLQRTLCYLLSPHLPRDSDSSSRLGAHYGVNVVQ